jgi:signal transduction histidine kinase/DNA-binding LacI/PurR family transcriptional regulator/CheY-like chemotaxis protein
LFIVSTETDNMQDRIHVRPTIGVLAGWQVYEGYIHGFLDLVLRGIYTAAQEQDCNLLLACGLGHAISQMRLHPAWPVDSADTDFVPIGPWNTDGLIVINPLISSKRSQYIQQVIAEGCPVVFVGPGEKGAAVVLDNESGIRQAIAHLVQHGHQHIAFIAGHEASDVDADSTLRLKAYRKVLQEYGLIEDQNLIAYGYHDLVKGRKAMQQLLESNIKFTAVLASNDHSAIGAMEVIRKAGLRIPQDIAVIGFDDWPDATGQDPPLTSIHYPIFDAGRKALDLLLEIISGGSPENKVIQMPVHLIVRESCGCLPDNSTPTIVPTQADAQNTSPVPFSSIVQQVKEAVWGETHFLAPDEINILCTRLVKAFESSVKENNPGSFRLVFRDVLRRVEEAGDDSHVWHTALSRLEESAPQFLGTWDNTTRQQVEEILCQARIAISTSIRRQYQNHVHYRAFVADQVGLLTSRLFMALNENQIFEALAEYLPQIGINHIVVAFFESERNDPVAQSRLYIVSLVPSLPVRFPSRQFPPPGLFPGDKQLSLALFPLVIQGMAEGYVAFDSIDLDVCATIARQLAAALRGVRLHNEAIVGRQLAEEANRMKSRFLSTVSHELRTPLNLIVGLTNLLLLSSEQANPPSQEDICKDIKRIYSSAQYLDGLIRDVLDLSRDEAGQLKLACEPLNLVEVWQPVVVTGEQMARDKGLDWRSEIPTSLPRVWGDRTRLCQVVLNLVNNAIKFTAQGKVTLIVRADDGRGIPDTRAGMVTVQISDTGLGISPEEQTFIFDEFRQSERTTARGYGGLGLGLAICKRLVEMHGGRIWVESTGQEGMGSIFSFTLPVIQTVSHLGEMPSPDKSGILALLVAKRSGMGKELYNHFTGQGYHVEIIQVDESSDWMQLLLTALPGAVVLDASLIPKLGWEIINALKENPVTHDMPVFFYSLKKSLSSILEFDYLTKPIGSSELIRTLTLQGLDNGSFTLGKTILVVDDEPGILDVHARIVQTQFPSCRVLRSHDGREALDVIRRELPDLVLLDLMMPELDGYGVLEAMREDEAIHDIPVIVLTGQVLTEEDMARFDLGVTAVLQKGIFSAQETMNHVESALARAPGLGSQTQHIVHKAMAYIHEHYAESFSRQDLARHLGLSERYLTRCFHQEMSIAPLMYLNRYRLKQAKTMLEVGTNVTETALAVGFSSVSYFTHLFKKEVGILPSTYRHKQFKR